MSHANDSDVRVASEVTVDHGGYEDVSEVVTSNAKIPP